MLGDIMKTDNKTIENLNDFWNQQFEFQDEKDESLILLNNESAVSTEISETDFTFTKWIKATKKLLFFLPGVLLLFMSSQFLFYAMFVMKWDLVQILAGIPWLFLWSFMMMFGIGDYKKTRSLLIPASTVAISFFTFLVSTLLGNSQSFLFYYSIFLFPLVLIIPHFLKEPDCE